MTIKPYIDMPWPAISQQIWDEKYRYQNEADWEATCRRVTNAVYAQDARSDSGALACEEAYELMCAKLWMPAGRIISGAGTDRDVTLVNCFVAPLLQDSLETDTMMPGRGIFDNLKVAGLTLQRGGGIGTDFSPLRPRNGIVKLGSKEASSVASGPVSFMHMWDRMSATMASAGQRRGAMMATLRCDHPDIEEFITAKHEKGVLTQFNASVLVSDAFMGAVKDDREWRLQHTVRPAGLEATMNANGYVYKTLPARELWEKIMRSTYEYSEPGVIFIDRVNKMNPLYYCEDIQCSNPCGEQMLPPDNPCVLGHVNLARIVKNPFTPDATVNFTLLRRIVRAGVRFLDNVIDVTKWPTPQQQAASMAARRIGVGHTGIANLFQQLGVVYGSDVSETLTNDITSFIACEAYNASMDLAMDRGCFPLYEKLQYGNGEFVKKLPSPLQTKLQATGIRNGVILSVAPTGTTSLVYDDVSAGIEPELVHRGMRTVIDGNGVKVKRQIGSWGLRALEAVHGRAQEEDGAELPEYMVAVHPDPDLTGPNVDDYKVPVQEQLRIFAAAQNWTDSSISKTINCPQGMPFEDFEQVYRDAYDAGCKGCTTYVESDVRGVVIEPVRKQPEQDSPDRFAPNEQTDAAVSRMLPPMVKDGKRPRVLPGRVHRVKIGAQPALYVTLADVTFPDGRIGPWEIFVSAGQEAHGWAIGLCRLASHNLRRGDNPLELAKELSAVHGFDAGWLEGGEGQIGGAVAAVASTIIEHMTWLAIVYGHVQPDEVRAYWRSQEDRPRNDNHVVITEHDFGPGEVPAGPGPQTIPRAQFKPCPSCNQFTLVRSEGCYSCPCGWSNCG